MSRLLTLLLVGLIALIGVFLGPRLIGQLTMESAPVIVDDEMHGDFMTSGPWRSIEGGYAGDVHVGSREQDATATWMFYTGGGGVEIEIYMTWPTGADNIASNAQVKIIDGTVEIDTITIDQRAAPGEHAYEGEQWMQIGTYTLQHDPLRVVLTNAAGVDGYIVADAVAIVYHYDASGDAMDDIAFDESSSICGDTTISGMEECDDGNVLPGDGCSHVCRIELCNDSDYGYDLSTSGYLEQNVYPDTPMQDSCMELTADLQLREVERCSGDGCMIAEYDCSAHQPVRTIIACMECLRGSCATEMDPTLDHYDPMIQSEASDTLLWLSIASDEDTHLITDNQEHVLLRLDVTTGHEDILLEQIKLTAASGDLANAENYNLRLVIPGSVDSERDATYLRRNISPIGGILQFADLPELSARFPSNTSLTLEVTATPITPESLLQLQLALPIPEFVRARTIETDQSLVGIAIDGNCESTCAIDIARSDGITWHIADRGAINVTDIYQSETRTLQLLGGSLSPTLLTFEIAAPYEPIRLKQIQLSSRGNRAQSIAELQLFHTDADGTASLLGSATSSDCTDPLESHEGSPVRSFCLDLHDQEIVIEQHASKQIDVNALIQSDAPEFGDPGISGEQIAIFLQGDAPVIQALGTQSLLDVTVEPFEDIVSQTHMIVMSKIISITDNNPDSTELFTQPVREGIMDIGALQFDTGLQANDGSGVNDVVVRNLLWTVQSDNVGFARERFRIYNAASASATYSCIPLRQDGSPNVDTDGRVISGYFYVLCENLDSSASPIDAEIGQNSSTTLVLQAEILNERIDPTMPSTLHVYLENIYDPEADAFGVEESHLEWIDRDGATEEHYYWIDQEDTGGVWSTEYRLD